MTMLKVELTCCYAKAAIRYWYLAGLSRTTGSVGATVSCNAHQYVSKSMQTPSTQCILGSTACRFCTMINLTIVIADWNFFFESCRAWMYDSLVVCWPQHVGGTATNTNNAVWDEDLTWYTVLPNQHKYAAPRCLGAWSCSYLV